jgi:hypothetical protein
MKLHSLLVPAVLAIAIPAAAQITTPRVSPKATVMQTIGLTEVSVNYSRPGMKGREIWGSLVPYGQVWRTGANEATIFKTSDEVTVNGSKLAAGTYSLHSIPGQNEWTIIFNKVAEQWGSYSYDEKQDALRVKATPKTTDDVHDLFTIAFPEVALDGATMTLAWGRVSVPVKIDVDTAAKTLSSIKAELAKQEDWRPSFQAASYAFQNEVYGTEAMTWIDRSISMKRTAQNLGLKARMMAKAGNHREAIALGEEAVRIGQAATPKSDTSALEKQIAEWKAKR